MKHGYGVWTKFASKSQNVKYTGMWSNDKTEGYGILQSADSIYEG